MKNRIVTLIIAFMLSIGFIGLPGCDKDDGPMEKAGEKVDEAGDKLEDVGEEVEDAVDEIGDEIEE